MFIEITPFFAAYDSNQVQAARFILLAIWLLLGIAISTLLFLQNTGNWQFNTSSKVLALSVYVCVANVVVLATDPWLLSIDATLFILPIYISTFSVIYLSYTLTAFNW